jgi:branched-chain amino acid transport system permease protein
VAALNPITLTIQTLNGISLGMLLFMLASGLTLITGLMGIVNLAQGSYYLLAAYVGVSVLAVTGNFVLAAVVGLLLGALLGLVMQRFFLHRFYQQDLAQVLMTFGFLFVFQDISLAIWKGAPVSPQVPGLLAGPVFIGQIGYPSYRVFIIFVGLLIALGLWLFVERTRFGAIIRAGVDDEEMLRGLGVNVPVLFTAVFALGAGLAGLSGVLGSPIIGIYPGVDLNVLLLAFVVLIVGGLGSLKGAFFASFVVGLLDNFGKAFFPELSQFTIFVPMALILAIKPTGLFGKA